MTIISPVHESGAGFSASTVKSFRSEDGDSFKTALSKAIDKPEEAGSTGIDARPLNEIPSREINIARISDTVSGKTVELLDLLDAYSEKLNDPAISLRQLAPDLKAIHDNAGRLLKETRFLSDSDADLKTIATRTIVAAQTEYLKFQRGDYV